MENIKQMLFKKTIYALISVFLLSWTNLLANETLIGYWNFNEGVSGSPWNVPIHSNAGVGDAKITGGTWTWNNSNYTNAYSGNTANTLFGDPAGASLSLISQDMNGNHIMVEFTMEGYTDLEISYWTRKTSTGFNNNQWAWSTDGENFTDFGPVINPIDDSGGEVMVLNAPAEINNAPNVYLRYTLNGATSGSGNNRIDNLQLNATEATDATLSVFKIGGIDVLHLEGLIVDDPDTEPGALLYVEDFTDFEGVEIETNHEEATYEVTLNDAPVDHEDLETLPIEADDIIVVSVTAQDGVTVLHYKVSITAEIRELGFITPAGGEEYTTGDEVLIEWLSENIDFLDLHVYYNGLPDPVATYTDIDATEGEFTENLPNGAHGTYYFRLYDSYDHSFYAQSENVTFIDNQPPVIMLTEPANEDDDVDIKTDLKIYFDEEVWANEGNVIIHRADDDSIFETIDVTSEQVSIDINTVTITLTDPLDYETSYYVIVDHGAFADIGNNPSDGIDDPSDWSFTTMEEQVFELICNGDFEDWTDGLPDCWYGVRSSISQVNVVQYSDNPQTGSYAVQLINTTSNHVRFTSQPTSVETGTAYEVTFWIKGKGDIRTGLYDTNWNYNSYISVDSDEWSEHSQLVTATETTGEAEFIFSLMNTSEDRNHLQLDNVSVEIFITDPIEVDNIAELRDGTIGAPYKLTGEAILTFKQEYRNQKFIQDGTAAILIDDFNKNITTDYDIGDGITGLTGTLSTYGGMLQIIPAEDPGEPSSTGNTITPEEITLEDITSDDQAKLLLIKEVEFENTGTFSENTNYNISDPTGTGIFRTIFYDADYIGDAIPSETINLVALMSEFFGVYRLAARSSEDFEEIVSSGYVEKTGVKVYPNPFTNNLYFSNLDDIKSIVLMNSLGQVVNKVEVGANDMIINTSEYKPGIYFLRMIKNNDEQITKKLIKK